jgi:hypothetical protein
LKIASVWKYESLNCCVDMSVILWSIEELGRAGSSLSFGNGKLSVGMRSVDQWNVDARVRIRCVCVVCLHRTPPFWLHYL